MQRPIPPKEFEQPESFAFSKENMKKVEEIMARYPSEKKQSALLPVLMIAQRQNQNWLPIAAMEEVARLLEMPFIRVQEVATFYSMYNLTPMGKYHLQACTTTPCWLNGSDEVVRACSDAAGINVGGTSEDGLFTLTEVECLGACVNAPMIQVTSSDLDVYYEDLDYEKTVALIREFQMGREPEAGSAIGRKSSEPKEGPTSLENQRKIWEKEQGVA